MRSNDIKSFIIRYYQYFVVGVLFVCLVAVLVTFSGKGKDKKDTDKDKNKKEDTESVEVPDVALEQQTGTPVSQLVEQYFKAMGSGDTETLSNICAELDEKAKIRIEKKAEFIDDYDNLECYVKPGATESSYIVFGYYEIKFKKIDTAVPGLSSLYIDARDDGSLYVDNSKHEDKVSEYIKAVLAQDDVVELLQKVDTKYRETLDGDETLKNFLEVLPDALDDAVSAELAARESQKSEGGEEAQAADTGRATVKETINVRKAPSTDGEKLGQLMGGDSIEILDNLDNGWSKIDFQGQEAYVKTEFLEVSQGAQAVTSENTEGGEQPQEGQENQEAEQPQETQQTTEAASGRVEAKEAVSIRKGPSTDAEKVGSAYKGDKFDMLGTEGDWTKIKYNGQTAYIKSEFVSKL